MVSGRVYPSQVANAVNSLRDRVRVATVIGFLGAATSYQGREAEEAVAAGAGAGHGHQHWRPQGGPVGLCRDDIKLWWGGPKPWLGNLETCYLTDEEKVWPAGRRGGAAPSKPRQALGRGYVGRCAPLG